MRLCRSMARAATCRLVTPALTKVPGLRRAGTSARRRWFLGG